MNPQFPLYIPSKGRADYCITMKVLDRMGTPYRVVVEEQEYDDYARALGEEKVLVLDKWYQDEYNTCDELGYTKSKGPGPARNFIWEHSISEGHTWHWTMDDNIQDFYRLHKNRKIRMGDGTCFRAMEDFCLRYENVYMAGPNYEMFAPRRQKIPPFVVNTRIYSCNLIRNDIPHRWRGRYNEDTILSLDILKDGFCTIQFNAFLQRKISTQVIPGGNTKEFYTKEGTYPKSKMLQDVHPDVSRVQHRFNRIHHYVDYRPFRKNKLIRRTNIEIATGTNDYGMKIVQLDE